jgi:NDP-sugar pyrophosphorylase family protein
MVLTAGLGTRLDPITRLVAKPAVPLGDSTLIEHVLGWLAREGVRDVVLNLHHRPATIAAVVGDGSHLGVSVRYSWEHPLLGSAGGPRHALPLLDTDPILLVNGDTLCEVALAPMLAQHRATGADVTLAVIPNPDPDRYGGFTVSSDDALLGVVPRGQAEARWHFVGVQIAQRAVFAALEDNVRAETVSGIYRARLARHPGRLRVFRTDAAFLDVGTPRDYLETGLRLAPARDANGNRSVVWPGAVVSPGAQLSRCIVAGSVQVPSSFEAHDRIILPRSVVAPGETVELRGELALFAVG